ncbi:MAG: transposase [Spirochaetota bacterium]|nr:transposase [Spirochaetota bacterium]
MARPLRVEYEGAWYHITTRGNERGRIFRDDRDRKKFIDILRASALLYQVEVHCYVLMSNHFHLLLKTVLANLSRFMQRFNTTYTMYYNTKHGRSGHLYEGRYKAIVVEADEYLLQVSRYLHLNPVKIKVHRDKTIEEKEKILRDYKWSSFSGYVTARKRDEFIHFGKVLSYMGGDNRVGRRAYRDFVLEGLNDVRGNLLDRVRAGSILGSDGFIDWIGETILKGKELRRRDHPRIVEIQKAIETREIARAVAEDYGVKEEELIKRRSRYREARQVLIELSYRLNLGRKSMEQLGKELGGVRGDAISHTHNRMQRKMDRNRSLFRRAEKIKNELLSH